MAVFVSKNIRESIESVNNKMCDQDKLNIICHIRNQLWQVLEDEFARFRIGNVNQFRNARSSLQKDISLVNFIISQCKNH